MRLQSLGHLAHGPLQPTPDPAVGPFAPLAGAALVSVDIHQHEASRVPQLVAKVAAGLGAGRSLHLVVGDHGVEAHVLDSPGLRQQTVAGRIRAVARDQVERVEARAQALAHAATVSSQNSRVNQHGLKGNLPHAL